MDSEDKNKTEKLLKKETVIKKVGGVRGWLLRKAKTFMWDAKSNTLVLPEGVVLTLEEKAELQAMFGEIQDQAEKVFQHRQQIVAQQQLSGVKFKANVVHGYSLLVNGTYRELTGVLAHKIHDNLQNMLLVNNRFLSSLWKTLSRSNDNNDNMSVKMAAKKGNEGR